MAAPRPFRWTPKRVDDLCDCIADGFSFKEAAAMIGTTPAECKARFAELRAAIGAQAL